MGLDYFPNPEQTNICIVTYDYNIHYYGLKDKDVNAEPTLLYVSDIQDPFIPLPK